MLLQAVWGTLARSHSHRWMSHCHSTTQVYNTHTFALTHLLPTALGEADIIETFHTKTVQSHSMF
jgi:succinate dehydrogenase/fumarate reductase cytochrome b subunit